MHVRHTLATSYSISTADWTQAAGRRNILA